MSNSSTPRRRHKRDVARRKAKQAANPTAYPTLVCDSTASNLLQAIHVHGQAMRHVHIQQRADKAQSRANKAMAPAVPIRGGRAT